MMRNILRLRWIALALGSFLLLTTLAVTWIFTTESGTQWALARVMNATDGAFRFENAQGTLSGPLNAAAVRFRTANGLAFEAAQIALDVRWVALLHGTLHVDAATVRGVRVALASESKPEESKPFTLNPPIDVVVDRFDANDVVVEKSGEAIVAIKTADFIGRWTQSGIAVERLQVDSPQGRVDFVGRVTQGATYDGAGHGSFRWAVGERTYVGQLVADARNARATIGMRLTAPIAAQADVSLAQTGDHAWTAQIAIPKFDPRRVVSTSSMESLAISLNGVGHGTSGTIEGALSANDEIVSIRALRFALRDQTLALETLDASLSHSKGLLHATGTAEFADVLRGNFDVHWQDLRLPKSWVGQDLDTHGALKVDGSAKSYAANGEFVLGPPGRLANIALDAVGSSDEIELRRLKISQRQGSFDASGKLAWRPNFDWNIDVRATTFDPGALLSAWKGKLNLYGTTAGRKTDAGIDARLKIARLSGTLRDRKLSGGGDLHFRSPAALSGNLRLAADQSSIEFRGVPGNANARIEIASLNDWIPDSEGNLRATLDATGTWPKLAIAASADGARLRVASASVATIHLSTEIREPMHPAGTLRVAATKIAAAGFNFAKVDANVSGNDASHRLRVTADGQPLSASLDLQGARMGNAWSGTLERTVLDVDRAGRFTLRAPTKFEISPEKQSMTELCLDSAQGKLCAAGENRSDGTLAFKYTVHAVPLRLANALAPTLPVAMRGMLEGEGDIQRSPEGTWHGRAVLQSDTGQFSRSLNGEPSGTPLLTYQEFRASASLDGAEARAHVEAKLDKSGALKGSATVSGLQSSAAPLSGEVEATFPSLAALALLTPQLVQANGRAQLRATLAGTTTAPKILGEFHASELTAQLPAIGIQIKDGSIDAVPRDNGAMGIAGRISSGDGQLTLQGEWSAQDALQLTIRGDKFLAANIPSARVVIAPDLRLRQANRQFQLDGLVNVSEASINIQKLPSGAKPPRASPDVVVVDAKTPAEGKDKDAASVPLFATLTVTFGDSVKVEGYGLNATVTGQLEIREQPEEDTRGSGTVKVAGTYKAYGQDLTIQRGNVLYADAPLSNPQLDITAVRHVEEVTAGLRISGSAQTPQLAVFSEPAMGEANALAYLVAGKPLDQVGTSSGEGDALQSAARSLEAAGGGLLAKKLGARLGLSEVSVKDNELIGGAAFTVGEYLSPRLFLSYGIGLFEPGEVVTLRYRLSNNWSVKTERGSEETRAGIQYRAER